MQTEPKRAYRLFFLAIVLVLLTPYLAPRIRPEMALVVSGSVSVVAIWIMRVGVSSFDWFHPIGMFAALFFLLFVTSGVIILLGISFIVTSLYGPAPDSVFELMNRATLYASAFLMAVYAGFHFTRPGAQKEHGSSGALAQGLGSWNMQKLPQLRFAAWLSMGCSYAGCVILVVIFGGIGNIIAEPMVVIESRGTFWPFMLVWTSLWSFGVFYISYVQERKSHYLAALLLTLPTMAFEFLTGGTKAAVIFPAICFLILRHYLVQRLNWRFIPKLAAFTLLVFAVGYSYRGDFLGGLANYRENNVALLETFAGRFYGIDSFMVILDATERGYPLQWGRTVADLLYFYVPRALWSAKPESYSLTFGREFLSTTSKAGEAFFTPTLPGELYLNFGCVGMLLGGYLMGLLLRNLYLRLVFRRHRGVHHLLVYAVVIPLVTLVLSGPIASTVEFVLIRCACFALFYWFAGSLLRSRARSRFSPPILARGQSS